MKENSMKEHAFRLTKGQDLKIELEKYIKENNIKAGIMASCVGCLYEAVIRNAGGKDCIKLEKKSRDSVFDWYLFK